MEMEAAPCIVLSSHWTDHFLPITSSDTNHFSPFFLQLPADEYLKMFPKQEIGFNWPITKRFHWPATVETWGCGRCAWEGERCWNKRRKKYFCNFYNIARGCAETKETQWNVVLFTLLMKTEKYKLNVAVSTFSAYQQNIRNWQN